MNREELKEKLISANRILDREDLARPFGHISARIPGSEKFLITRSIAPGISTLDDIVVCDLDGKVIDGKYSKTFGEVMAHVGVYKKRQDVNSVAHTHSLYVMALSMTGTTVIPASFDAIRVGFDPIPIYEKIFYIEKPEVGREVADTLGAQKAVILKGHGAIVAGGSIEETVSIAIDLERSAKLQWLAGCAGKVAPFTEEEKGNLIEFMKMMNQQKGTASGAGRTWEYYKSRA